MSTNSPKDDENQEVDLSMISKGISNFFSGISTSIFNGILFVKKNSIILISLIIVGGVGGYLLDTSSHVYDHEIIVMPNFGSVDYLYSKIDLFESKIKEKDTIFLKSIGIKNYKDITKIEVTPIIDVYNFVNADIKAANNAQNSQNFELVKLLSEDGDINKVIKDNLTSKNYYRHTIHIVTKNITTDKNLINPILAYLNKNAYFDNIKKTSNNNISLKIKKNEEVISQIDGLLNEFSTTTTNNQKSDKLVYYNENTQLNEIINNKNRLIEEIGYQKIQLLNIDSVIKETSSIINVKNTKKLNDKLKFVLPLFLIFGFAFFRLFKNFYRKQLAKSKQ